MGIKDPSLCIACSPRPHLHTEPSPEPKLYHHEERVVEHHAAIVDADGVHHQWRDRDGHFRNLQS